MQLIHIFLHSNSIKMLLDANSNLENIVLMSIHADPVRSTDLNKPSYLTPPPVARAIVGG
jgi:hypothetical protein